MSVLQGCALIRIVFFIHALFDCTYLYDIQCVGFDCLLLLVYLPSDVVMVKTFLSSVTYSVLGFIAFCWPVVCIIHCVQLCSVVYHKPYF